MCIKTNFLCGLSAPLPPSPPPFLRWMHFLLQPSQIYPGLGQAPNTAGLFTWWLADHDHDNAAKMQNKTERHSLPSHPPDIPTPSFSSSTSYQSPRFQPICSNDWHILFYRLTTLIIHHPSLFHSRLKTIFLHKFVAFFAVPSLPALGSWAPRSWTGPLARKYLPGFPYSLSLRRLRQKISSIYCTVICNYPSAAQEQPFTVDLFCITKTVKLTRYALLVFVHNAVASTIT